MRYAETSTQQLAALPHPNATTIMPNDLSSYEKRLLAPSLPFTGGDSRSMRRADGSRPSVVGQQRPDIRRALGSSQPNYAPYGHSGAPPQYPSNSPQYIGGPPHYPGGPNPYPGGQQPYPGGANPHVPQGYPHGGYYPPPAPSSNGSIASSPLISHWQKFARNQLVEVNIQGHGWLVGTVVAILSAVQTITGSKTVKVRYQRSGRSREETFPNDPEYIRPH